MLDPEGQHLAHAEYWDERYAQVGPTEQVHEWLRSFRDLEPFLNRHLFQPRGPETAPKILHLGSGDKRLNSVQTIPKDLSKQGYQDQICLDFSAVIVKNMAERHAGVQGITWMQADARNMDKVTSGSVDVAFDKSTLDAMIHGSPWDPPADVLDNTSQYIQEMVDDLGPQVFRVLKFGGTFICITYRQPHFIRPLFNGQDLDWSVEMDVLGGSDVSFDYYGFVLTKSRLPFEDSILKGL
ncbi:MAG: hypothetical protein Q9219_006046 [cf. Caloplaca sp. 3 TL-2023]